MLPLIFSHLFCDCSIDASDPEAGLGRWINDDHKAPNSVMKKVIVHDSSPHLCLFACDDIQVGEEIRYDYGTKDLPWRQVRYYTLFYFLFTGEI